MMDITVCIVDDTKDIRSALEQIVTYVGRIPVIGKLFIGRRSDD